MDLEQKSTHGAIYSTRKALVESWPATPRIKLGGGLVERCPTPYAVIDPLTVELVVFSGSSHPVQDSMTAQLPTWKDYPANVNTNWSSAPKRV